MRHNPAFVRINPIGGRLYCDRHGLLSRSEENEALASAGLLAQDGITISDRTPRAIAWLLDRWGRLRHGAACQP